MAAGEQWRVTRASEDRDWPGIWKVFCEVISHGDTYSYPPDMSEDQAKDAWIRKGCRAYVVKDRDEVVGTLTICTNTPGLGDHVANAGYMVHKDYRGAASRKQCAAFPLRKPRSWVMRRCSSISSSQAMFPPWRSGRKWGLKSSAPSPALSVTPNLV